ncbi:MAG: hypothetical protein K2P17_03985 [Helicobacteraceae bacterium]|nr:hypothetical protein [Helicobacteraceae bacterium]
MNNGNLVYKTYDISTSQEYTSGTRLNLSGVRTVKLLNRPSGVEAWISTDSNGTNLYPLINRGDGWELPLEAEPLYNLYVFTKGVNAQDTLKLSYTGEKNFFIFGNSSVERIGEIESLGNQAQIDINNAMFNYYNRIPLESTGTIFESFYYLDYKKRIFSTNQEYFCGFPLSDKKATISELGLKDDEYYRISILGHWDTGTDYGEATVDYLGTIFASLHITLFNDLSTDPLTFTEISDTDIIRSRNLYQLNKLPIPANRFNLLGLKEQTATYFDSGIAINSHTGNSNLNFDIIVSGATLNRYSYFGLLLSFNNYVSRDSIYDTAHASILTTISQAYNNVKRR